MADEKDDEKQDGGLGIGRWWEFYVVRYALGTVFGALIVHSLISVGLVLPLPNESLKTLIEPNYWPLLLAYGLAFCYLASAPILVFHAARFTLVATGIRKSFLWTMFASLLISLLWVFLVSPYEMPAISVGARAVACISLGFITFIFISQIIPLNKILNNPKDLWKFYKNLDAIRRKKENRELVNSYRHLREHGNAFFVVLLEIFFGLSIYTAVKIPLVPKQIFVTAFCGNNNASNCGIDGLISIVQLLSLILIWVLPATFIWTVGCLFEREFADDQLPPPLSTVPSSNAAPPP